MTGFNNFGNQSNYSNIGPAKISQAQWKEVQEFMNEHKEGGLARNILLQKLDDTISGGLRSANFKVFPAVYVINAEDSLDENFPFYVHFNIIPEMTKIVSIQLSFWFLNFRAYAKAATEKEAVTSGASSASSSASGGGQTPTSGASSASSSGGGGVVSSASGGGETPTSSSVTTPSGGGKTSEAASGTEYHCLLGNDSFISAHEGGYYLNQYHPGLNQGYIVAVDKNHTHTVPNHTHPAHAHTVTIAAHTHVGGTHTHNIEHTHTVTITSHTHNIEHTHNVPAHSHGITYGIFEEENSPTIVPSISRDNGRTYSLPLGSYTTNQELEITRFIDTAGSKIIKFTSNMRARISVQVTIKLDVKAR